MPDGEISSAGSAALTFEPKLRVLRVLMFEELLGWGGVHHILTADDAQMLLPILLQSG
jgi:hypothetical protein